MSSATVPAMELPKPNLDESEIAILVDLLRKSFLYQTPVPVSDGRYLQVRMHPKHYEVMTQILLKAGGWTLSDEQKKNIVAEGEKRIRARFMDQDVDYDFTSWEYGELLHVLSDLNSVAITDDMTEGEKTKLEHLRACVNQEINVRQTSA